MCIFVKSSELLLDGFVRIIMEGSAMGSTCERIVVFIAYSNSAVSLCRKEPLMPRRGQCNYRVVLSVTLLRLETS